MTPTDRLAALLSEVIALDCLPFEATHGPGCLLERIQDALTLAPTPAPLDVGPRLMAAVRAVIADGIDSPGVHNELHAAYYEARDHATPAPLDVMVAARAVLDSSDEPISTPMGDWQDRHDAALAALRAAIEEQER